MKQVNKHENYHKHIHEKMSMHVYSQLTTQLGDCRATGINLAIQVWQIFVKKILSTNCQ